MPLQIRIFDATGTNYREFPLSRVSSIPAARITASMGYADAEIILLGDATDSEFQDWQKRRKVEFWFEGSRGYRGYIERIVPLQGEPKQIQVTLYGRYYRLGRINLMKRYSYAAVSGTNIVSGKPIESWYQDLISRFVLPGRSNLEVQASITGYQMTSLDAYNVQLSSVTDSIISFAAQNIVIGCDVNPVSGNDRIYIRPNDTSLITPILTPGGATGSRTSDDDTTDLVNTITINGGTSQFANLLSDAVQGNTSFEMPQFSGLGNGNLVKDPSFELPPGSGSYAFTGGASVNPAGDGSAAGFARTGTHLAIIDNPGETIAQFSANVGQSSTPGQTYQFNVYAKLTRDDMAPGSASGTMSLQWQDSGGGNVGAAVILPVSPQYANQYTQYGITSLCPAGGVRYTVSFTCTAGTTGRGIATDDWEFFSVATVVQKGWEFYANGTSAYSGSNMAVEDAYHGGYSVLINATAQDVDGQDLNFRPYNKARFAVNALETYRFGFFAKLAPGQTTHPKLVLVADFYDGNGNLITGLSTNRRTINANSLSTSWDDALTNFTFQAPATAATCHLFLEIRGNGQVLADAFYCRDSSIPAGNFIEGSQYQKTYDVLSAGFLPGSDVYNQNVVNGAIADVLSTSVSVPNIATDADALNYAITYFSRYAVAQTRNSIVSYKFLPVWVGQYVRSIGDTNQWPRPTNTPIQPIVEIQLEWDGKLKQTLYLTTERLTQARVIKKLLTINQSGVGGGSSGSASIGGIGGAISGVSGVASLSPDPSGSYNGSSSTFTVNSAGQVTAVSVGTPTSGYSGYDYRAKLTPGGINGTAIVLNGVLTSFVNQPT